MEWIPEKVLQRFVKENPQLFQQYFLDRFNSKISYIRYNIPIDRYPDLFFVLEDKREIPVEVEWKTSNFDHELDVLIEGEGFLFVGKIEPDYDVGAIKQIEIPLTEFEKWFEKHASELVTETTSSLHKIDQERKLPKLWFTYLSFKGDGVLHFESALKHQVWGIQKNYKPTTNNQIKGIREGDLIAFIGPGKSFPGRVPLAEWTKKSFKGYFEKIRVFRVTRGYYTENNKIWITRGKWKDELFPHRFDFDRNPLIVMKDIKVNNLGLTSKKEIHNTVYSNIRMCDPHTLVDILHNAKQLTLEESKAELDYIFSFCEK